MINEARIYIPYIGLQCTYIIMWPFCYSIMIFFKSYINCHIANLTSCSKNKTCDKRLIKTDHAITRLSTGPMKRDR